VPEYHRGFGEKLIEAAQFVLKDDRDSFDSQRTVLYLSLLSCEIILKALLERAGKSVHSIRASSHKLGELLAHFSQCEVEVEIGSNLMWGPATSIRSESITMKDGSMATVGALLNSMAQGTSTYPNQIRYGDEILHFPPEALLKAAIVLSQWANEHWDKIRACP
jgi:hypothetical protein